MAQINFPAASESPWTNPDSGVTYEYVNGAWQSVGGSGGGGSISGDYLSLAADAEAQTVATTETTTFAGQVALPGGGNDTQALQKQEVEALIADPDGPADGNYLKLGAGAFNQTVASTGTTTFAGPASFSTNKFIIASEGSLVSNPDDTAVVGIRSRISGTKPGNFFGFQALANVGTSVTGEYRAFDAAVSLGNGGISNATRITGFYSDIGNDTGVNYTFYAAGIAPNYLGGDLRVGGTDAAPNVKVEAQGRIEYAGGLSVLSQSGSAQIETTNSTTVGVRSRTTGEKTSYIAFQANAGGGTTMTGPYVAYQAAPSITNGSITGATSFRGFESGLAADGNNNYNFFASNNAPNFFQGDTYIGGTTAAPNISLLSDGDVKVSGILTYRRTVFDDLNPINYDSIHFITGNISTTRPNLYAYRFLPQTLNIGSGSTAFGFESSADILTDTNNIQRISLFNSEGPKSGTLTSASELRRFIGFQSTVSDTSPVGAHADYQAYNFYAAGNAPNYFAGFTYFNSDQATLLNGWTAGDTVHDGMVVAGSMTQVTKTNAPCAHYLRASFNADIGNSQGTVIQFYRGVTDKLGTGQVVVAGTLEMNGLGDISPTSLFDTRLIEAEAEITNASNIVKQLAPKTITRNGIQTLGFNGSALKAVVSEAVG